MTTSSRRFTERPVLILWLVLAAGVLWSDHASAQAGRTDPAVLRPQIERRFDLFPLRAGIGLRPKTPVTGVRMIEVTGGSVALDGQSVTGAELRARVGADADLILQLSYLDDVQRRALLETAPSPAAAPLQPTAPPAPSASPSAPPIPPEPPAGSRRSRGERRGGDRVRFGGSVTVDEGESVAGDVVVIGGSARVDGQVSGDVVVVGGSMELGPHADVAQDAVVVGGTLRRDPGAVVGGEVHEVGVGPLNLDWRFPRAPSSDWWSRGSVGSTFSVIATVVRIGVLCLLVSLVALFAHNYIERIGARAVAEPLKAGAIGLLAQLLFVPLLVVTIVLFVVTIIGIPLLILIPFAILALMVFALMGFTAVAEYAGRWFTQRFGWTTYGPIATTVAGVLLIASPLLLARLVGIAGGPLWLMSMGLSIIGFVTEYLAWTIGLGAVALVRFSRGGTPAGTEVTPAAAEPAA